MHKWFLAGLACLILFFTQPIRAQNEGAIWYFGQNAGLDFNQYYPKPLTDGQITTREGVASICDKDGNLLFYTDGQTVYNRNHDIMQDGEGLFGDVSSTQSSIIVPRPGSETEFYIFTVDQTVAALTTDYKGINYCVVDMAQNAPSGRVTLKGPMPGVSNVLFTEKVTIVKHFDKSSYWIIAHEFGSNDFYEFLLTKSGITLKYTASVGSEHRIESGDRDNRNATGYLKSSPKGDFLVTAMEGLKFFELFSFNNNSGAIELIARLPAGNAQNPLEEENAAYGVEFSPTSNFLYGSTRKGGFLYQWDLSVPEQNAIRNSVQFLRGRSTVLCGALQLGLNGKIYVSLSGQPFLGVINSPIQKNCNYVEHGASLMNNATGEGGKAYFGLPTFLSDFFQSAEFYFENTCYRDQTIFYLSTRSGVNPNILPVWTIEDMQGKAVGEAVTDPVTWEGMFVFPSPGDFVVKMRITQFGKDSVYPRNITIHPLPELNFQDTTSMCRGSLALLDAGDGAFYSWADNLNLNVERYREINKAGKYVVTVTHYNGCSNTDSTQVVEKPLPVIDRSIVTLANCGVPNGSITLVMAEGDSYDFEWAHDPSNTSNQALNLSAKTYEVTITSDSTGCSITKKFSISEQNAPVVTIRASIQDTICPGQKVTLTAEGAANYLWEDPEGIETAEVEVSPMRTATYRVKGYSYDPLTEDTCRAFSEITIEVFEINNPQLGQDRVGCYGDTITLDGGSEYLEWTWSHNQSTQWAQISQSVDNLVLIVKDKNQCLFSDTLNILIHPLPEINLGTDITQCQGKPVELFGGTGDSLLWSTGEISARIFVDSTATYALSVWENGCLNRDSVQVTIKPLPEVQLNLPRDTTICLSDSLELHGGNGDTYLWSTGETSAEIYAHESGTYWLTISMDGCLNSDSVDLTINPLPKVDLGKDAVYCKSDKQVLLSGGEGEAYIWGPGGETTQTIVIQESGKYFLTISNQGCTSSDTVDIRINDPALLVIDDITQSPVTCPGSRDGSLIILAHGSGSSYEYSIDNGINFSGNPWFQGLEGNIPYQIVVREDQACTVTHPEEVIFKEPDSIKINYHLLSPSCETCPDGEINLSIVGGTPPYSVKWSTQDTLRNLTNMVLGKYLVWVTDAAKCRESALIDLSFGYPPFQIPNAFTPNGDGINERWEIAALRDFPDCELKIFNRSGKLIWWSETGYPEAWDGSDISDSSHAVLPAGSYYYLVWLARDLKPLKGSVSILK